MIDEVAECVIRERRNGYSILEISMFCKISASKVREILRRYGDPLKKIRT